MSGREFKGSSAINVVHEDIRKIDVVFERNRVVVGMVVLRAIEN